MTIRTLLVWLLLCGSIYAQSVYDEVRSSVAAAYPNDFWRSAMVTKIAGQWHNRVLRGQKIDVNAEVAFYRQAFSNNGIDLCGIATPRLRFALQQAGYG